MKRKIYLTLFGGLGNQLFQYACALNLSREIGADLVIDHISGFIFDRKFKRNFNLPKNFNVKKINFLEFFLVLLLRIIKKLLFANTKTLSFFNIFVLDETKQKSYLNNFKQLFKNYKIIYLIGFFQTEKYFFENKQNIINTLSQNKIKNIKLKNIERKINKNSLMIGIRLFEEAPGNIKKKFGGIEKFEFYKKSIEQIKSKTKISNIFIFSTTNKDKIRKRIKIKSMIIDNYNDDEVLDIEYILLFSKFRNFIISNSTFYWWGAYLAGNKKKINVVYSNKFTNKSTIPFEWKN